MYIDKYLSWDFHIHELSKKLSRANGILSKVRYNAPSETCLQVYYAIFFSHLIYGCNVWGLTTQENLNKIEVLQKKCVRILTFSHFTSCTNHLFTNLKLLKVNDIIKFHKLKLVYDFLENDLPSDLMNLFRPGGEVHTTNLELNSARKNLIHIPSINTNSYGNKSIKYHCAKLWNEMFKNGIAINRDQSKNVSLSNIKSGQHFKKVLKKTFLIQVFS